MQVYVPKSTRTTFPRVPVDFDDSFGKGIRSFLRHIVADAIEDPVRIFA